MTIWFTSDTHYSHAKIIEHAKRPFESVNEMDEAMINRWNAVVKPSDSVYHLGDFALCHPERATAIARRLRGQKFLIFGNHDKRLRKYTEFLATWQWARDLTEIRVDSQRITLCHYAMRTWSSSHHGTWQLYGHSHGSMPENPRMKSTDVGVDCWDYSPVSFETLRERMSKRGIHSEDCHIVKFEVSASSIPSPWMTGETDENQSPEKLVPIYPDTQFGDDD